MLNEEKENQAKKLKVLFDEVNNHQPEDDGKVNDKTKDYTQVTPMVELDVLNLPPRREVHTKSKRKLRVQKKSPLLRFMIFLIILLAILAVVYYFAGEQILSFFL